MTDHLSKQARTLLQSAKRDQPAHESVARTAALLGLPSATIASLVAAENAAAFAASSGAAAGAAAAAAGAGGANVALSAASAGTTILAKGAAIGQGAGVVAKSAASSWLAPGLVTKLAGASVVIGAVTVGTVSTQPSMTAPIPAVQRQGSTDTGSSVSLNIAPTIAANSTATITPDATLTAETTNTADTEVVSSPPEDTNNERRIAIPHKINPPSFIEVDPLRPPDVMSDTAIPDNVISQELSYLTQARSALRASDPARCLGILADYAVVFPRAILGTEARVLKIEALKLMGANDRAEREAIDFMSSEPGSLHSRRLQQLGSVPPDLAE